MDSILLEIGGEEIPAGYIEPALDAMAETLAKKLAHARISHGNMTTYGTPRRLAVIVADVAPKQASLSAEIQGPPLNVGKDAEGNLTVAGTKFAEKVGVSPNRLKVTRTEKGEYLCARKTDRGRATSTVLKTLLPEVVLSVPFPKSMRWADLDIAFARPIHSIAALYGKQVITFTVGNVKSGRYTNGHYFMDGRRLKIGHPDDYVELLRKAGVIVDISERREMVAASVTEAARKGGGRLLEDPELIDIVTNLVESPYPTVGHFEEAFLEVPQEVLITAMREHQKYFAVVDENAELMASFIAVNNTRTRDMDLVATGHERVLRARLSDAKFFYQSDVRVPSEQRVDKLKGVLFLAELGNMYDKTQRIRNIGRYLADTVDPGGALNGKVSRAAELCKSDLVSQVVVEFPKLQGVMGRVYAQVAGEPADVCAAIEEHYQPTHSGGALPGTLTGALVSIADKIDSICGCFSVGLIPTGGADPYALRRQAIGIIQIINDKGLSFSLRALVKFALQPFEGTARESLGDIADRIGVFLQRRIERILADDGYAKDVIAAVTDVSIDHIPNVWRRVEALSRLKDAADFEPLAVAFKRVVNIIRKSEVDDLPAPNPAHFQDPSESALFAQFQTVEHKVSGSLLKDDFEGALVDIASLRPAVDDFFDKVMVMTDDPAIRHNRLALLGAIAALFDQIADFSKISS